MEIFGKRLNVQDYDCSFDNKVYPKLKIPRLNLYVQITKRCNATCKICNTGEICENFDFEKFETVLKELSQKIVIGKVAITGGEPLTCVDKTLRVIRIARKYCSTITLNTNGSFHKELERVYPLVDQIDVSKHYYDPQIHDAMMGIETLSLSKIASLDKDNKISINCVLQKGAIDCYDEMINFLEYAGECGIKFVKFISLLPLTEEAVVKYIDPSTMMNQCKRFTNTGMLYDHQMCRCFEFLYLSKACTTIKVIIRHTTNSNYSCVKQFVFNGKNLFDGFLKHTVIV